MENSLDMEDCIPPTPQGQIKKACARIDKNSIISSKLSRKLIKNDKKNFKRKRIISPCKSVKQKVKQVTLYNFLMKGSQATDFKSESLNSHVSTKVNLLDKFEGTENKSENVKSRETMNENSNTELKNTGNKNGNIKFVEYENNTSNAKFEGTVFKTVDSRCEETNNDTDVKFSETLVKNDDIKFNQIKNSTNIKFELAESKRYNDIYEEKEIKNGDVQCVETIIKDDETVSTPVSFLLQATNSKRSDSFKASEYDKCICEEVAALEINAPSDNILCISKDTENLDSCSTASENLLTTNEEKSKDIDQTFSDCLEIDKMNFEFSCIFDNNDMSSDSFMQ